jgi:hypothetical protein
MDYDGPLMEKMRTTHERREARKAVAAHLRKSTCAKKAFSRKQGLTGAAVISI